MEESILDSTKKMLGMESDYTAFDLDVITHINSVFVTLSQLAVGSEVFAIEDAEKKWSDLELPQDQLSLARSYIWLKVRLLFDPPATSFHIEALNNQIKECEGRLSISREWALDPVDPKTRVVVVEEVRCD